ncbi:MAG: DNA-3-methyladenine glycosylase [Lachnospiraceae bacterium]|nr:DNA-3-methyladenine glycosylase [Lachnospiraceae bacterium]
MFPPNETFLFQYPSNLLYLLLTKLQSTPEADFVTLLLAKSGTFYIADAGIKISEEQILSAPRINIDYAEEAKDYPWRFYYFE